jgi:hypothetical protein
MMLGSLSESVSDKKGMGFECEGEVPPYLGALTTIHIAASNARTPPASSLRRCSQNCIDSCGKTGVTRRSFAVGLSYFRIGGHLFGTVIGQLGEALLSAGFYQWTLHLGLAGPGNNSPILAKPLSEQPFLGVMAASMRTDFMGDS